MLDPASLKKGGKQQQQQQQQPWRWEEIARTSSIDSSSLSEVRSWRPLAIPLEIIMGHYDAAVAAAGDSGGRFKNLGPALSETLLSLELEVYDARNDYSVGHTRLSLVRACVRTSRA